MHKALLTIGLVAALALPMAAQARSGPPVICGTACDGGGGGWTGCTTQTESHSSGITFLASVRHYLVVSYCKRAGVITSISIAAHGCDTSGIMACSVGPAWQTGGGVGSGYASFEAHASWFVTTNPFYISNDTLGLTVNWG